MRGRRRRSWDRGRWAVQRERLHLDGDPPAPPMPETGIGEIVEKVVRSLNLEQDVRRRRISREWQSIVGPQIAAHTRPGRLRNGNLVIFVDHSLWLQELSRFGTDAILSRLQQRFGGSISKVRLQLDPEGPRR